MSTKKWRGKLLQDQRISKNCWFFFLTSIRAHEIALKCSTLLPVFLLINVLVLLLLPAKLTSSVFVAEVREAPHVAQSNDGTGNREKKLHLVAPLAPFLYLIL